MARVFATKMVALATVSVALGLGACSESGKGDGGRGDSSGGGDTFAGDAGWGDAASAGDSALPPGDSYLHEPGGTGSLDPAPEVVTLGEHRDPSCPDANETEFTLLVETRTSHHFTGYLTGATAHGTFYVYAGPGEEIVGVVETSVDGYYSVHVPLFCGAQVVKLVWEEAGCTLVLAYHVLTSGCTKAELRVTTVWDGVGRDWELHLIKPGGRINDNATDCTWTSCIHSSPDWGVVGDASDDPVKDVDDLTGFGPESIYLGRLEAGVYTVMVEHWNSSGDPSSDGYVLINYGGGVTRVDISDLAPYEVWTAAQLGGPNGVETGTYVQDCSGNWSLGCRDAIP